MAGPHAKRPFWPDPSVTLHVLRLRRTRFEDEIGIALEFSCCAAMAAPMRRPGTEVTIFVSMTYIDSCGGVARSAKVVAEANI